MGFLPYFRKYLRHQLQAKNAYGIHSPFVFSFYNAAVRKAPKINSAAKWEKIRKALLSDPRIIKIQDLGAGSRMHRSDLRHVKRIAAVDLKPLKQDLFIFRLVTWLKPDCIIELGTSLGISSTYMADAAPEIPIHTIEGSHEIAKIARETHLVAGKTNIQLHEGNFDAILPELLKKLQSDKFILCADGNHQKEATLRYFNWTLNHAGPNSLMIIDDIHWSPGMEEAWESIIQHPDVSLSLDLFFLGLIFFKQSRAKEHFKIRFW